MKLLSYMRGGQAGYGMVVGSGVFDLGRRLGNGVPALRDALHPDVAPRIARLARSAVADFALDAVEFLPPIPDGGKIIAVGRNFGKHVAEGGREMPKQPMLFARYPSSHVGHDQAMVRPFVSEQFDFEGELAVVIGRPARHVAKDRWRDHVAGYTCFNDGSVRDWQFHTQQIMSGKTFWRSGSFGPWIVTADEIPDPHALMLRTRLNGVEVQSSRLDAMIFDIPSLIHYISTIVDLQPGDVIATGTPEGVGYFRKPQLFMKQGDVVEVEIERIGVLRNPIVDEPRPAAAG